MNALKEDVMWLWLPPLLFCFWATMECFVYCVLLLWPTVSLREPSNHGSWVSGMNQSKASLLRANLFQAFRHSDRELRNTPSHWHTHLTRGHTPGDPKGHSGIFQSFSLAPLPLELLYHSHSYYWGPHADDMPFLFCFIQTFSLTP